MLAYFVDPAARRRSTRSSALSGRIALAACARSRDRLPTLGMPIDVEPLLGGVTRGAAGASAGRTSPTRWSRRVTRAIVATPSIGCSERPAGVRAATRRLAGEVVAIVRGAGGLVSLAHPGADADG